MFRQSLPGRRFSQLVFCVVVSFAALAAIDSPCIAQSADSAHDKLPPTRRMTVSGTGEFHASPDKVDITVGVVTEDKLASSASQANADLAAKVTSALVASGIPEIDIQTTNYNVIPITSNPTPGKPQAPVITTFRVTNEIRFTLRDIKKAGSMLDLAIQSGANLVNGFTFGIIDPEPLRDKALTLAVKQARHKADILALAAGVTITGVYEVSDSGASRPTPLFTSRSFGASEMQTPVSPGEMAITANVTVVYEISGPERVHRAAQPAGHAPIEKPQTIK
jgi:hypothetical protein